MEKYSKITIVTPVFNGRKFIKNVIKNIQDQEYKNVEHIIIDGGSTDGTVEILQNYKGKIKYVSEKDKGQSDAINKGFRMATGEIITWLGVDDYYADNMVLNKVADYFSEENTNIIYGRCKLINLTTGKEDLLPQNPVTEENMIRWWNWYMIPAQPAIFFRKKLLDECGYLDLSLNYTMDHDLWHRFIKKGYQFQLVPEVFSIYQVHEDSKTGSSAGKFLKEHMVVSRRYWGKLWQLKYWRRCAQYYYAKYYKFEYAFSLVNEEH
jgi:glycosyltransferase involved in cell wall biosynthesis